MKKFSKILSVFLVVVTLFSMSGMVAGAISASSKKEDMLKYYENCLTTTAKKGLIKVDNTWKYKITADYSGLAAEDAKETKEQNEELFGKDWNVEKTTMYCYGITDKSQYIDGQPDTVWWFSIKRRISEFKYKLSSATLEKAENGDITIVFKLTKKYEDGSTDKITITTKTSKSSLLKSFTLKQESDFKDISLAGKEYPMHESTSDSYKITYKKVAVESIELSESAVTLDYGESCDISVIVKPSNATYPGFYCTIAGEDTGDVVAEYSVKGNVITLTAVKGGTGILQVYTYDGAKVAECEITVTVSFWQSILNFFADVAAFFMSLFPF